MPGIAYAIAAHRARFEGATFALHDVDPEALDLEARLTRSVLRSRDAGDLAVEATTDLAVALDGATLVLTTFRPGGLAARHLDESIPPRHGIVGQETVGPGGMAMAFRSIPVVLAIAEELARRGTSDALVLNYTNPVQLVGEACLRHAAVPVIGLCDQSAGEAAMLARLLGVDPRLVELDTFGTNHLTWTRAVRVAGADRTEEVFAALAAAAPEDVGTHWAPVVRLFPLFGEIPNLYLQYYLLHDEVLAAQRAGPTRARQIQGELPRILASYRREADRPDPRPLPGRFSEDHGDFAVSLMAGMLGDKESRVVLNVPNRGAISDLPAEAVVEVPCRVRGRVVQPLAMGPLPPHSAGLVRQVAEHARLAAEAAVRGDAALAVRALALHPLVRSVGVAKALVDDLLAAHADHLPQFGPRQDG